MEVKEFKIKLIDDNNNKYSDLLYYPIGPNDKGHGFGSQLDMVYSKIYRKDCLNYTVIIMKEFMKKQNLIRILSITEKLSIQKMVLLVFIKL